VPIEKGRAVDGVHGRIARAAVDLDWLSQRGAKVIVIAHLGRPKGRRVPALSLAPVAKRLIGLLGSRVKKTRSVIGKDVKRAVEKMKNGDILLLENVRFDRREIINDPAFAQTLGGLGDLYVNDAFSNSHRNHASMHAITKVLPSYAGPLLSNEVSVMAKLDKHIKHPFVLVMGGLKMRTKLPVIERFLHEADAILLGGAISTTFFVADGYSVGKSVYDKEGVEFAGKLLKRVKNKIILPTDFLVSTSLRKDAKVENVPFDEIGSKHRIVDIGKETIKEYERVLSQAKTIVWNGPLGYCEIPKFCNGTEKIAKVIAARTGKATTIVGGGDTVPVLDKLRLADKFTLLSTGGGAMLKFLANEKLPGLEVLKQ